MPGGADGNQVLAGTTPKASPMVPPGEATTSSSERLGVAEFVAGNVPAPNPKAKAAPKKKRSKKTGVKKTGVKVMDTCAERFRSERENFGNFRSDL